MPEALAIIAVAVFVTVMFMVTVLQLAGRSPREKLARLHERLAWLEERERRAHVRGWDEQMRDSIASQLAETRREIAALNGPPVSRRGNTLE